MTATTHNPFDESHAGELLEGKPHEQFLWGGAGERAARPPRQPLTRQLDIRNIKTTLGMEVLRCLTPQMVEKELWVYLLAYNLIRLLMAQAARDAGVHPRELSFKHTVQMWTEWASQTLQAHPIQKAEFFRLIAQLNVGNRPGRIEPRARKRRPKSYPWLKVPRAEARQQIQTHGHLLCA